MWNFLLNWKKKKEKKLQMSALSCYGENSLCIIEWCKTLFWRRARKMTNVKIKVYSLTDSFFDISGIAMTEWVPEGQIIN